MQGSLRPALRLSLLAAVLLAVTSAAVLLFGARGLYQPDPQLLPQLLAQEAVGLTVALPLLLGSMRLARRNSLRGLLLWSAMLFYLAYWYYFYVAGVRFGPLFLVHAALVSTSLYALLELLRRVDADAVARRLRALPARPMGGALLLVGAGFSALWMADVFRRLASGVPMDAVTRQVQAIDLVVVLPLTAGVGIAL